jgi:hypothetical protein
MPTHVSVRDDKRKGKGEVAVGSLQERLDAYKKEFESGAGPRKVSPEGIETMHRATAELKATGIEGRALKVGDRAPAFAMFNQDHVEVASGDLLRSGPLVLGFFRGHW